MKTLRLGLAGLASALAFAAIPSQAGTIVLGGYPDQIQFVDDASGKVVQKVTLETGLPDNIQLSADRSKIYVTTLTTSGIEVLDAASRKVVNKFSLNTPTTRYRFTGGVADPTGRWFYTVAQHYDKEIDLYRVSKPQYVVIDLKTQKIARAVDIDKEDEGPGYRTRLAIAPDGKTLYVFDKKIRVIDTATLKVADRIDLAKPEDPGMRDVSMGGTLETLHDPNAYVSVFNAADPYIHNKVFGIARFDLTSREFKFTPIGPARFDVGPAGHAGWQAGLYRGRNRQAGGQALRVLALRPHHQHRTGKVGVSLPFALLLRHVARWEEALHLWRGLRDFGLRRGDAQA
ncbi:YncE family protein [Novosphingobium sp. ST904]|uniref:YncE family protein n=1 Tax=Novosphingobium sp. ST904 TaxID=1684385 RepID=UPI000A9702FE|nr:hypothetical protein [Novosphingobium sp. ST904]